MIRFSLIMAAGLAGAAATSQVPEYSQQYMQRLGGAVDALAQVVADFDASAAAEGLTRQAALEQMTGSPFVERRRADMTVTLDRYVRLGTDLAEMRAAGPLRRPLEMMRPDGEIARAAWQDFEPAMPLTLEGAVFGGAGFVGGACLASVLLGLMRLLTGRRREPT